MFGSQNDQNQDDNQIPDHSIDGAAQDWQHPGTPLDQTAQNPQPQSQADEHVIEPTHHEPADVPQQGSTPDELAQIKQQALSQLSPLVGHLEQSPEEKFRTTMMMIQASDDQSLVQVAYEAAQQISDEKAKAQALLDIVNEINYFTQHHNQ
jgi:hypothetical protein